MEGGYFDGRCGRGEAEVGLSPVVAGGEIANPGVGEGAVLVGVADYDAGGNIRLVVILESVAGIAGYPDGVEVPFGVSVCVRGDFGLYAAAAGVAVGEVAKGGCVGAPGVGLPGLGRTLTVGRSLFHRRILHQVAAARVGLTRQSAEGVAGEGEFLVTAVGIDDVVDATVLVVDDMGVRNVIQLLVYQPVVAVVGKGFCAERAAAAA